MSKTYYYFAASLPTIDFDSAPPMSCEDFLDDCERLLDPIDYELVSTLLAQKVTTYAFLQRLVTEGMGSIGKGNAVFVAGARFTQDFRNEQVAFRAERAHKDPAHYIRGERYRNPEFVEVVQRADQAENLLEGERILDRARWDFLDQIAVGHFFDFEFLIIYGVKLTILERYKAIKSDAGATLLNKIKETELKDKIQVED